jgi:hypothetical protein
MHHFIAKVFSLLAIASVLVLAGCQTPNLKPFATASVAVTASINQGGDHVIELIARQPGYTATGAKIAPGSADHPAVALAAEWQKRRTAADAICTYSGALVAIGEASAHRQANAEALYDSVKALATSVPGVGVGVNAAGNLMVGALNSFVEVKAWHDMASAVQGANPAVQAIASFLKSDMASLARAHEAFYRDKLLRTTNDERFVALVALEARLRKQQDTEREAVSTNPSDVSAGNELSRLSGLMDGVLRDLTPRRQEIAGFLDAIRDAERFYAAAIAAIDAWSVAHADLARGFEKKRTPNLALLAVRAAELNALIEDFKKSKQPSPSS